MKIFIILVLAFLFSSCKKEKSNCWECQVIQNGVAHEEKMCGNADGLYKDAQGNDLQCYQIH